MIRPEVTYCFCTATFGKKYILLAKLLADDLARFAPDRPFIVLTNQPNEFEEFPNVVAIKHGCQGVQPYHERRFAIAQALQFAPTAIYLDSDVRICSPVPDHLDFLPGLTARNCTQMGKHLNAQFENRELTRKRRRKQKIVQRMAEKAGIDWYAPSVKFINEFLFAVTIDHGRELEFLRIWGEMALYADTLGMHQHPSYAMAIAAEKSQFPIYRSEMPGLDFFDDRVERYRIKRGESTLAAKATYLAQQEKIEQDRGTIPEQLVHIGVQKFLLTYRLVKVRSLFALRQLRLIR